MTSINTLRLHNCYYYLLFGCTSKFEVRINPQNPQAIQTPDPDLRSRPIQTSRSRPMIQTSCFILFGFVDPDPLFYFGVNMLDPAPSLPLWLDCGLEGHAVQLLAAASLLLAAAQLEHFGSRPVTKIWSKSAYPVPDLVPHRSRPVPDRSRSFLDRSMESNLMEEEFSGQCKSFDAFEVAYTLIIMIQFTPFQTCGTDVLRKWPFQTCGSPRNVPDPFTDA